jgi:hypothetical protein
MREPFDSHGAPSRPPYEPDTPPQAEDRLDKLSNALEANEQALKEAAGELLDAEEDRDSAWRTAMLSEDCPKVGVFNKVRTTVAYQAAWVADQIKAEERALREAQIKMKAAEAQRRKLEGQLRAAQSITASVRESYRGSGRHPW